MFLETRDARLAPIVIVVPTRLTIACVDVVFRVGGAFQMVHRCTRCYVGVSLVKSSAANFGFPQVVQKIEGFLGFSGRLLMIKAILVI